MVTDHQPPLKWGYKNKILIYYKKNKITLTYIWKKHVLKKNYYSPEPCRFLNFYYLSFSTEKMKKQLLETPYTPG